MLTEQWLPAIVHGVVYTMPFLFITTDWRALLVIGGTHAIVDHYRLAKRIMWLGDRIAPRSEWSSWAEFKDGFGGKPEYRSFWLMVIVDNLTHIMINYAAIDRWG